MNQVQLFHYFPFLISFFFQLLVVHILEPLALILFLLENGRIRQHLERHFLFEEVLGFLALYKICILLLCLYYKLQFLEHFLILLLLQRDLFFFLYLLIFLSFSLILFLPHLYHIHLLRVCHHLMNQIFLCFVLYKIYVLVLY